MVPHIHAVFVVKARHSLHVPSYVPPSTVRIPSQVRKFRFKGERHYLKTSAVMATASAYSVPRFGFRIEGRGLRAEGRGYRVEGTGLRVEG